MGRWNGHCEQKPKSKQENTEIKAFQSNAKIKDEIRGEKTFVKNILRYFSWR